MIFFKYNIVKVVRFIVVVYISIGFREVILYYLIFVLVMKDLNNF